MSNFFKTTSPYLLWSVLALPGLGMLGAFGSDDPNAFKEMLHPTGEFSARFMIIAMLASPLALLLKGWRGPIWMKKNRRYFGVAAFMYAALHTLYYVLDAATVQKVLEEVSYFYIWTGWIAFAIFIPLAITSSDYFVRLMGRRWKTLQRWTYGAAVLTLLHWAALHDWGGLGGALVHFVPLGLLEAYRVWYWYIRPRKQATAS